jgi:hypothetical protein
LERQVRADQELRLANQRRDWLVDLGTSGRGGKNFWLANQVFDIIEAPASYLSSPSG